VTASGLRHPLLAECGVEHAFGERDSQAPRAVARPVQVHGCAVARLGDGGRVEPAEADAIVSDAPGRAVGVVTADCVPILAASRDGRAVAAIHAGWKGLARGVIAEAIEALARLSGGAALVAVVGPHIGPDHYEVDAPVLDALAPAFGDALTPALRTGRPGHAWLDLGRLARTALERSGLAPEHCAALPDACTYAHPRRFHSFRRDGERAGRLLHHIAAGPAPGSLDSRTSRA
jgi:YfiH family protein